MGGGLCQLSRGMYHLALQAGLHIEERHNHSVDLYTPSTRYTPLGSDTAVAWAFKDLRLVNSLDQGLSWRITVQRDAVCFALHAERPITPSSVRFEALDAPEGHRRVRTWRVRDGQEELVNLSSYRQEPPRA